MLFEKKFINLKEGQTFDDILKSLKIGSIYYIGDTDEKFYEYTLAPMKKEYVGQLFDKTKCQILRSLMDKYILSKVKLTFRANRNTTVNVFFTKNSYDNNKPDDTISLIANQEKTTTYNRESIYTFVFDDSSLIKSAKIAGALLDCYYLFNSCDSLTTLDLSKLDTSKVTDMNSMFGKCAELTSLDVSNFNTSNVTDMADMFAGCESLIKLDVTNFDTSNVTNMADMFEYCYSLSSLDVSNFNTSKVTDMSFMFDSCPELITIGPVDKAPGWQHKPNNYTSMFSNCPAKPKPSWYK